MFEGKKKIGFGVTKSKYLGVVADEVRAILQRRNGRALVEI